MELLESRNLLSGMVILGDNVALMRCDPPPVPLTDAIVATFANLPSKGFAAEVDGYSISANAKNPNIVHVISLDDGRSWVTGDGGETWTELVPPTKEERQTVDQTFVDLAQQVVNSLSIVQQTFDSDAPLPDNLMQNQVIAAAVSSTNALVTHVFGAEQVPEDSEFAVFTDDF